MPRTRKKRPTLTAEQVRALLRHLESHPLRPFYMLIIYTGLREGEALGLRWHDIDLERAELTVNQVVQYTHGKGLYVKPYPKNSSSVRTVPLSPAVVEALRQHRRQQDQIRAVAGPLWQDHGLVFCTGTGRPYHPSFVLDHLKQALREAGLPVITLHDLRHTFATLLLERGESLKTVSEILGHSTIRVTADRYQHVRPATARRAIEKLDDLASR